MYTLGLAHIIFKYALFIDVRDAKAFIIYAIMWGHVGVMMAESSTSCNPLNPTDGAAKHGNPHTRHGGFLLLPRPEGVT